MSIRPANTGGCHVSIDPDRIRASKTINGKREHRSWPHGQFNEAWDWATTPGDDA